MTKCIIVDDEPLAIKVLETHISDIPSLALAGTCSNAIEALSWLQKETVDLMFLDINMPKLMGHQFLRTLRNPPKVIFTTAYKDYALDAFDLDVVDYLLKPITLERLLRSVNKMSGNNVENTNANSLLQNEGFVYVRADRKMVKLCFSEILYIESMKDYIKIVRANNKPLLVKQPLSSIEEMLPGNLFLRIHRSYIVSVQQIVAYTQHEVEINGEEIPVGRLYANQLGVLGITQA